MRLWQKTRDTRDEIEIRDDADARSCISLPCILPRPTDEAISVSVKASISSDTNVTMTLTDAKWGSTYDGDGPPPGRIPAVASAPEAAGVVGVPATHLPEERHPNHFESRYCNIWAASQA